jgi:formate hydrogenlyase subunit 6/NADH:ubiquinone oxidoreductase subunit I
MIAEILAHLFAKPATTRYPSEKAEVPATYRGKIKFIAGKCVGCMLCMKDCPSNAITITKIAPKKFECSFALDACMFCSQCVESCNKDALETTMEFELAALDRDNLKITFHALPDAEPAPAPATGAAPASEPPKETPPAA